jgi:XRE family aerobic/anaerobic benzoate catabolism transcriptional regulator
MKTQPVPVAPATASAVAPAGASAGTSGSTSDGTADGALQEEAFLLRIGERVRAWRERRHVTRKMLAQASGVSERYLAQLEAGQGNMSILLLRQVARAMRMPLDLLVSEAPDATGQAAAVHRLLGQLAPTQLEGAQRMLLEHFRARHAHIALVGLRGAGKSTLGKLLAAELGVPFIELDREVEREAGAPLAELFGMVGQAGFRRYEQRALDRVLAEHTGSVIATGGGLVSAPDTYERLLSACFTVWLRAAPEEHMARVVAQGDLRPLQGHAAAMDDLRQLLVERTPLYARADAAVDTAGRGIRPCLAELLAAVRSDTQKDLQ